MSRPTPPQSSNTNLVIRMLARRENSTWSALPMKRGLALHQGREAAPEWANQHIEVVFAHIRTGATPHRLESADTSVWRFDSLGKIDLQHAREEVLRKLNAPKGDEQNRLAPQLSKRDLEEICAVLRVQPPD